MIRLKNKVGTWFKILCKEKSQGEFSSKRLKDNI
jgi:hypothetical protein